MRRVVGAVIAAWGLAGCEGRPATHEDCVRILDRIVEIELGEQGFRDPELALRKQGELERTLARELARCEGRRLAPGAMVCVRGATSSEEISHRCLR